MSCCFNFLELKKKHDMYIYRYNKTHLKKKDTKKSLKIREFLNSFFSKIDCTNICMNERKNDSYSSDEVKGFEGSLHQNSTIDVNLMENSYDVWNDNDSHDSLIISENIKND